MKPWRPSRIALYAAALAIMLYDPQPTQAQVAGERGLVTAPPPVDAFTGEEFSLGSLSASHSLIIYLSVTCAHCAAFHRDTWPELQRQLIDTGEVRVTIRELPSAPVAAAAAGFLLARCTGENGYWPAVERLLARQAEVLQAPTLQAAVAREVMISGLNVSQAQLCLSDPTAISAINVRRQAALAQGIDSTPFFYVDGRPLRAGARLAGSRYLGGEITFRQLAAALHDAGPLAPKKKGAELSSTPKEKQ